MIKKIFWFLFGFFSVAIALYPLAYILPTGIQENGLLQTKTNELLADALWQIGFKLHIFCGGLALLIGWLQFIPSLRKNYIHTHRLIGKAYVIFVLH